MTTLTAESSPELDGSHWPRVVALYGIGPLIAVILTLFLARDVKAKQDEQLAIAVATNALVQQHAADSNTKLDLIARQLEANCKVQAVVAKNEAAKALCEVTR